MSQSDAHRVAPAVIGRLSAMMFIQFFLWGSWYVTAPLFLDTIGFAPSDKAWTYSVGPIAGIISPFIVGMIADRFFPTQIVLGVMHLLGAGAMFGATTLMTGETPDPKMINVLFFIHMLCFFPTLALTNSLAMQNITDSEKQFPLIRVFGTIGWIVPGWILSYLQWGNTINMFYIAAGAGVLMGLYCFTLPHTPPPAKGQKVTAREVLGLDALQLLKKPSFGVFMLCSFLICIPLAFYYQLATSTVSQGGFGADAPRVMSYGQISEIFFMLVMPFFFMRLGVKWMLALGMLAWVVRYGLFAFGAPTGIEWMLLIGVVLHGICYDFFFVTGQIYTDKAAPNSIRSQAQGMLVLFTLGIGMLIGAQVAGMIEAAYTPEASVAASERAKELSSRILALPEGENAEELTAEKDAAALEALQAKNWKMIWLWPCIGAGAALLFFLAAFKDDAADAASEREAAADVAETPGPEIV